MRLLIWSYLSLRAGHGCITRIFHATRSKASSTARSQKYFCTMNATIPNQSSFTTYAIHLIKLRLASLYHTLRRIKEIRDSVRENLPQPTYNSIDTVELDQSIERDQFFGAAMKRLEGAEKEFLRLILQGEKQQDAFVQVLARYGPIKHPGQEIKNVKAKLLRKLQALAGEMGYEAGDLIRE